MKKRIKLLNANKVNFKELNHEKRCHDKHFHNDMSII